MSTSTHVVYEPFDKLRVIFWFPKKSKGRWKRPPVAELSPDYGCRPLVLYSEHICRVSIGEVRNKVKLRLKVPYFGSKWGYSVDMEGHLLSFSDQIEPRPHIFYGFSSLF